MSTRSHWHASRRPPPPDPASPADYKALKRHLPAPVFVPLPHYRRRPEADMLERARAFHREMDQRRTTRHFATDAVPRQLIELAILTAGTAPSGAHRQSWRFVAAAAACPEAAHARSRLGRGIPIAAA
jgi:Nitroreductase family